MRDEIFAPTAVLDGQALRSNIRDLVSRSALPIRLASKSIRVRALLEEILERDEFIGVLAYSAAEARWLAGHGVRDVLVGYPTLDRATVDAVSRDPVAARAVTFTVDLPEHLDFLQSAATGESVRIAIDIDCSLRVGPLTVGAHRSRVFTPDEATELAARAERTSQVELVGLMFYEAQVASVPDTGPAVRLMKNRSWADLQRRRARIRSAVEEHADLDFVNAGGTGSLHWFDDDGVVTDLAAGSGLFAPTMFEGFDQTALRPAAFFVSPVIRKPKDDVVVTPYGGFIASGPVSAASAPTVAFPAGLKPFSREGFGEVQTPLRGPAARNLKIGDPVWFRHAKAGEMCERFDEVLVLDGEDVRRLPTYRGEGMNFG